MKLLSLKVFIVLLAFVSCSDTETIKQGIDKSYTIKKDGAYHFKTIDGVFEFFERQLEREFVVSSEVRKRYVKSEIILSLNRDPLVDFQAFMDAEKLILVRVEKAGPITYSVEINE